MGRVKFWEWAEWETGPATEVSRHGIWSLARVARQPAESRVFEGRTRNAPEIDFHVFQNGMSSSTASAVAFAGGSPNFE